uniref:Peptidase M17 leucyl aminopeptidase N-terminal domain-containing protein n=1 Tax=Gorilla gorilla gorilla TaxID=9595 RepID=A0A2I2Y9L8_GORGO
RLAVRCFGSRGLSAADMTKGLVLGIYSKEKEDDVPQFTSAGENLDKLIAGKLRETLNISGPPLKAGKTRTFYGLHQDFPSVVLVGLGKKAARIDEQENWQEGKENIRAAVAAGCRQIQDLELPSVEVDPCGDAQAAEEGAVLGLYEYDDLKQKKMAMSVKLYGTGDQEAWQKGVLFASGQNLTPASEMMPTRFAEIIEKNLKSASKCVWVHIQVHGCKLFFLKALNSTRHLVST